MKRINAKHDNKDRIVCVTTTDKHEFYYQPVNSKEILWLFDTKEFSGSVFAYFRNHGKKYKDKSYSLTIKELYEFKNYSNSKLAKIIQRIPNMVEYVICETDISNEFGYEKDNSNYSSFEYEYAA